MRPIEYCMPEKTWPFSVLLTDTYRIRVKRCVTEPHHIYAAQSVNKWIDAALAVTLTLLKHNMPTFLKSKKGRPTDYEYCFSNW
jgi:hypothetical protein